MRPKERGPHYISDASLEASSHRQVINPSHHSTIILQGDFHSESRWDTVDIIAHTMKNKYL